MNDPLLTFNPQGWLENIRHVKSPNYDARPNAEQPDQQMIRLIVVHSICLPPSEYGGSHIDDFFCNQLDATKHPYFELIKDMHVSSHFLIKRTGEITQFVSCLDRAWHAGQSIWRGQSRCNDFSIGIELEGLEGTAFTNEQYGALSSLTQSIAGQYPSIDGMTSHSLIAPGRKKDPGAQFEWARLQQMAGVDTRWLLE